VRVEDSRRNGHAADVVEQAAALRWALNRVDEDWRDAVATDDSPQTILTSEQSVEVKACQRWIENGDEYGTHGRWHIHRGSHEELLDDSGQYALGVYDRVAVGGQDRILLLHLRCIPAAIVDDWLPDSGNVAAKIPWLRAFENVRLPTGGSA